MDSLTQIALGAAVGEAALGRRVGNVAPAWGAVLGTLPDLDVLLYPFLDPVSEIAVHRGFSHSIVFSVVMAPVVGSLLARLHRTRGATTGGWSLLAFLALFTHLALDSFTVYGTQVFWPFSDYPVSFDSIFIIDPLYTAPLAVGALLSVLRGRKGVARGRANAVGLALSGTYLAWTLVAKAWVERDFRAALDARGIRAEHIMTNPTPLNSILWMGVAEARDTLWVGLQGLLDGRPTDRFIPVPKRSYLLEGHERDRAVARLAWFSKGWEALEADEQGRIHWNDVRFGRNDAWLATRGDYVFRFALSRSEAGTFERFDQEFPEARASVPALRALVARALEGPPARIDEPVRLDSGF